MTPEKIIPDLVSFVRESPKPVHSQHPGWLSFRACRTSKFLVSKPPISLPMSPRCGPSVWLFGNGSSDFSFLGDALWFPFGFLSKPQKDFGFLSESFRLPFYFWFSVYHHPKRVERESLIWVWVKFNRQGTACPHFGVTRF